MPSALQTVHIGLPKQFFFKYFFEFKKDVLFFFTKNIDSSTFRDQASIQCGLVAAGRGESYRGIRQVVIQKQEKEKEQKQLWMFPCHATE